MTSQTTIDTAALPQAVRTTGHGSPDKPRRDGTVPAKPRFEAIDIARGICILLVVLLHSNAHNFLLVFGPGTASHLWETIASIAKPIRMPAFFLVSGFLAHRSLSKPWADCLETRVLYLVYLYVVWLLANVLVHESMAYLQGEPVTSSDIVSAYVAQLIFPSSFLWFLYALVFYFVLARLLRSVPAALCIGVALVASAFSEQFTEPMSYIVRCFVFYMIGARLPQVVTQICARASYRNLLLSGIAYAAFVGLVLLAGPNVPGVWLPSSFAGLVLILMLAQKLSGTLISKPFVFVGKRTLPIYVLHPLLLAVLALFIGWYGAEFSAFVRSHQVFVVLYPIAFIFLLVMVCLGFHRLALALRQNWLFELPRALVFKPKTASA